MKLLTLICPLLHVFYFVVTSQTLRFCFFLTNQNYSQKQEHIMVKVFLYVKALTEAFLDHLWKILQNPSQPAILRQAAAGYLGSFLSRAKFIPVMWVILLQRPLCKLQLVVRASLILLLLQSVVALSCSTVRACLDLLISWIHGYIDSQNSSGKQACCDVNLHGPFYSTCQAVFYVLIFRHRAMLEGHMKKGNHHFTVLTATKW